jgi:methionyl-tRNA formyltransferase
MRADDDGACTACAETRRTLLPEYTGEPLRVVFMGTPEFAATILRRMLEADFLTVCAVYTRPDKPAGRGRAIRISPVKALALERSLPIFQPRSFIKEQRDGDIPPMPADLAPDVLVTAAYGLLLPRRVLDVPKLAALNVHASLLPLYRGAAPVQRALMDGVRCTGVSIMLMTEELDAGPILMQRAVVVGPNDTCGGMLEELADEGADLLLRCLRRPAAGLVHPVEQDASRAGFAPKITGEECLLDFSLSASVLHDRIRGLHPRPGAYMLLRRKDKNDLRVIAAPGMHPLTPAMRACLEDKRENALPEDSQGPQPECGRVRAGNRDARGNAGRIVGLADGALLVACGDGAYAFTRLRPEGRGDMEAAAFYNGYLAGRPEAAFVALPAPNAVSMSELR